MYPSYMVTIEAPFPAANGIETCKNYGPKFLRQVERVAGFISLDVNHCGTGFDNVYVESERDVRTVIHMLEKVGVPSDQYNVYKIEEVSIR